MEIDVTKEELLSVSASYENEEWIYKVRFDNTVIIFTQAQLIELGGNDHVEN